MKTLLKILAWLGLLIIALGLTLSFSSSSTWVNTGQLGSGVGYFAAMCLGALGAILAFIGGFITRPKYFWLGSIVVGVAYIASFYGYVFNFEPHMLGGVLLEVLPGLACIAAGIVILSLSKLR